MTNLLIRDADLAGVQTDVRCRAGRVVKIGDTLEAGGEPCVLAAGGALLPSLHDHHSHLFALAASNLAVKCGPPQVTRPTELESALCNAKGTGWIRGVGYHESVAGDLTALDIDAWVKDRPVRIQHRSGRLWFCNTMASELLSLGDDNGGQLYRQDELVADKLGRDKEVEEELSRVSSDLASFGVTHVTDATPVNDDAQLQTLRRLCPSQHIEAMGGESLSVGHLKIILDDYQLPDLTVLARQIERVHEDDRAVAIHCVSKVEIVFAIAAITEAGMHRRDRLEHGTVMTPDLLEQACKLGLTVVPNPNFIFERGDQYILDAASNELDYLYPVREMYEHGVPLLFGTDAPFGNPDPWLAMRAAVNRKTRSGASIASTQCISPELALNLFTNKPGPHNNSVPQVQVGDEASFCVLNTPWRIARERLHNETVQFTICDGEVTFERGGRLGSESRG